MELFEIRTIDSMDRTLFHLDERKEGKRSLLRLAL